MIVSLNTQPHSQLMWSSLRRHINDWLISQSLQPSFVSEISRCFWQPSLVAQNWPSVDHTPETWRRISKRIIDQLAANCFQFYISITFLRKNVKSLLINVKFGSIMCSILCSMNVFCVETVTLCFYRVLSKISLLEWKSSLVNAIR